MNSLSILRRLHLAKLSVALYRDSGVSTKSKQPNLNIGRQLINNRLVESSQFSSET